MTQNLDAMQADMRQAYCGGAAGMFASATVWLTAATVALRGTPAAAIWTLFVGGMLIHPAAMLLSRLLGRRGVHSKGNPLARLAGASTVWLIAGLPLAYAASRLHIEWFFPAMLLVIGSRFLAFETLYGLRAYTLCGIALLAAGLALGSLMVQPAAAALIGAVIEGGFGVAILLHDRRASGAVPATA